MRRPLLAALCVCACGPPGPREVLGPGHKPKKDSAPIVTGEQAQAGSRLVLVDERGRRQRELTDPPTTASVDISPAFSPDGRLVVYASSRGRAGPRETSLWIVAVAGGAPVRLTDDAGIDITPAFAPDGKGLVFGSTRGGGDDLDLWRLDLDDAGALPRAAGLRQLTDGPEAEHMPAFSPDGKTLAWVSTDDARVATILLAGPDTRAPRRLVAGTAPAFSPDGRSLAYAARPADRCDLDLWMIDLDGGNARRLVDERRADQTMPRFSRDGRFLFATAVLRESCGGRSVVSTIVVLEPGTAQPSLHALQEAIPSSRNGVDVGPGPLDSDLLRGDPTFADALRQFIP